MDTRGTQAGEQHERAGRAASPGPPAWLPWLLALWALLAWGGSLSPGGAAFDDLEGVLGNPLVNGERPLAEAFTSDYWHHRGDAGHYRPTGILSLAADHFLYGDWLPGYHLTGLLLHAAVVLLAAKLLLALGRAWDVGAPQRWGWMLGLAVFAMHPALADAVAWISARTSTLAILPGLLAAVVLCGRLGSGPRLLVAAVAGAGLLACLLGKEDGYLGLVPIAAALAARRRLWVGLPGLVLAVATYLTLRAAVYGSPLPSAPHSPLAGLELGERLTVGGRAMLAGFGSLAGLFPSSPNHGAADWRPDSDLGLLGWALWLMLATYAWRGAASRTARLGLVAALLAWLPFQGWVPAGEVFAERFLYLPALFAAPLAGELLARVATRLFDRPPPVPGRSSPLQALAFFVVLLGAASLLLLPIATWQRARPYGSLLGYHSAVLEAYPHDATAWNGLALAREEAGDLPAARASWERAIALDPTYGRPHSNLGRLALEAGRRELALEHFEAAVALGTGNPVAFANLGSLRLAMGDDLGARAAYRRATELAPGMLTAWRGLARAELALGQLAAAEQALGAALELAPADAPSRQLAAELRLAKDAD